MQKVKFYYLAQGEHIPKATLSLPDDTNHKDVVKALKDAGLMPLKYHATSLQTEWMRSNRCILSGIVAGELVQVTP